MTLDAATVNALAEAVVERLRPMMLPAGWPADRATLREPEAAGLLGMGVEKLNGLRKSGAIGFRRCGHTICYSPGDVTEYLEKCKQREAS